MLSLYSHKSVAATRRTSSLDLLAQHPREHRMFHVLDSHVYHCSNAMGDLLCIPDIKIDGRSVCELCISQAHSILAHLGSRKTIAYLRGEVWWPSMVRDTHNFCVSCAICATSKSATVAPAGLLKPLLVPTRPLQSIGIDFVGPLLLSSNRHGEFNMICVVIDHLTSMVHLAPTDQTYGAKQIAEVIFDTVYKLHGLPEQIVSDQDALFTSTFWQCLHELLQMEIHLSSAYHPQTDGATEHANRTMTQMLCQCVRPDQQDWVTCLPAIEFAMNSTQSDTTGFSPFYFNHGQTPQPMTWNNKSAYPGIHKFAETLKSAIMTAHDTIIAMHVKQMTQANRRRRPADFSVSDMVYLSTKNLRIPKGRARKLVPKYLGPFRITKELEKGSTYQLDLSPELRVKGINPSFHVSLLRPHFVNDDRRFPGRMLHQLPGFGNNLRKWDVRRVISHSG